MWLICWMPVGAKVSMSPLTCMGVALFEAHLKIWRGTNNETLIGWGAIGYRPEVIVSWHARWAQSSYFSKLPREHQYFAQCYELLVYVSVCLSVRPDITSKNVCQTIKLCCQTFDTKKKSVFDNDESHPNLLHVVRQQSHVWIKRHRQQLILQLQPILQLQLQYNVVKPATVPCSTSALIF